MQDPKVNVALEERPVAEASEDGSDQHASDAPEIVEEIMIEEINIDGMCGVY